MSKESILVIDDDEAILEVMVEAFENKEYKVFSALNGVEGLKLCSEKKIDVILLDLNMPRMDGYMFMEHLSDRWEKENRHFQMPKILVLSAVDVKKDFGPGGGIVSKHAQHGTGGHAGPGLFDTANGHATVGGVHDHRHTFAIQMLHKRGGHLIGQAFLYLGPLGITFHQPGQFGNAHHLTSGDVGHMGFSGKGQQVMFAGAGKGNVPDQYDFIVRLGKYGLEMILGVLPETFEDFFIHPCYAGGGIHQAFPVRIFPHGL